MHTLQTRRISQCRSNCRASKTFLPLLLAICCVGAPFSTAFTTIHVTLWTRALNLESAQGLQVLDYLANTSAEGPAPWHSTLNKYKLYMDQHAAVAELVKDFTKLMERTGEPSPDLMHPDAAAAIDLLQNLYDMADQGWDETFVNSALGKLMLLVEGLPVTIDLPFTTTRRLVVSVLSDLLARAPNPALLNQAAIERILHHFLRLYYHSASRKTAIAFSHMSKTGGTTMCEIARANGCRTHISSIYQWAACQSPPMGDSTIWLAQPYRQLSGGNATWSNYMLLANAARTRQEPSCERRAAIVREDGLQYVSNERYMPQGQITPSLAGPCPQFLNVALLRNPIARLGSQLRHLRYMAGLHKAIMPTSMEELLQLAPYVLDNRYVRYLLGEKVFLSPVWSLLYTHAEAAIAKLLSMDVLLVVDDVSLAVPTTRYGLGWRRTLADMVANSLSKVQVGMHPVGFRVGLSPEVDAQIATLNALDMVVYRYALWLAAADTVFFDAVGSSASLPSFLEEELGVASMPQMLGLNNGCGLVGSKAGAAQSS